MKKFALLAMGAVTFLSTFDSSEAQILQRFRSNIRQAISPLVGPPLQVQPFNGPSPEVRLQPGVPNQPRYVQPQVRIQRPAPQLNAAGPQRLTPYSRLTPQQRVIVAPPQQRVTVAPPQRVTVAPPQRVTVAPPQRVTVAPPQRVTVAPPQRVTVAPPQRVTVAPPQRVTVAPPQRFSTRPTLTAPAPVANPVAQSRGDATIRIVTYYDPRSGSTFQRRFLLPGNSPTVVNRAPQGQIATGRRSIFIEPSPTYGAVAGNPSVNSIPQSTPSLVPPIQFSPQVTQQPANVSSGLAPALAGPVLNAPTSIAQPIAASIDRAEIPSQVETVSLELETTSTGIPDLSGITIDPAPLETTPTETASLDSTFAETSPMDDPAPTETAPTETAPLDFTFAETAPMDDLAPTETVVMDPEEEEASQDLFFDGDSTDEIIEESDEDTAGGLDFSVLEEVEE